MKGKKEDDDESSNFSDSEFSESSDNFESDELSINESSSEEEESQDELPTKRRKVSVKSRQGSKMVKLEKEGTSKDSATITPAMNSLQINNKQQASQ